MVQILKRARWGAVLCCTVLIVSCSEDMITSSGEESKPPPGPITFSKIQSGLFDNSCALSGCHRGSSAPRGLDLSAGKSYQNLVGVPSRENPQKKRVDPGNSGNSYLIQKLQGNGTTVMPPPPAKRISSAWIDSVRAWIDRGAPNN